MRKLALMIAAVAALFVFPISAFSQSIQIGPGGVKLMTAAALEAVDNVKSCVSPAKTRTG